MKKVDVKQNINSNLGWQAKFLANKFIDVTNKRNVLFNLPNSMCFSFGLKEIISICEVSNEINNKSYFYLAKSFYDFLKKDKILKEIDDFAYINLLRSVKKIVENRDKINLSATKNYMEKTYKIYYKKYLIELQNEIINIIQNIYAREEDLDFLSDIFINELLSMGYTYKYLNYIFNYYYYENKTSNVFSDMNELIIFLLNKSLDTFDMYLPIKNVSLRDINFVKNQFLEQEIIKGIELDEDKYGFKLDTEKFYCHIYFTANDYFKSMEDQLNRVNSIFNILKFYTNSQISLDFDAKPYIHSNKIGIINRFSIKSMLQYSYFQGTTVVIDTVNKTFEKLTKVHNPILMDIYDIMNYSQKNHDIFSNDQFLSKWISLESCASKVSTRKGFDAVLEYVTKALSISFYRQKITRILKHSEINCTLEYFIKHYNEATIKEKIENERNNYYKYVIKNYTNILSNNLKFYNSVKSYQEELEYMLYRIYIMRNKFVHSGNTLNNNDMLRYYLNIIEPFFVDKILKTLNTLLLNNIFEYEKVTWDDIFNEIDYKFDSLNNSLLLMKEKFKICDSLSVSIEEILNDSTRSNLIINFLVEHSKNMKTVKSKTEYNNAIEEEEILIE